MFGSSTLYFRDTFEYHYKVCFHVEGAITENIVKKKVECLHACDDSVATIKSY